MSRVLLAALTLLLLASTPPRASAEPVTLFAAASLTDAMEAVAGAYQAGGGEAPRFSFAASSTLARQIEAGAPADIYLSAHSAWMNRLEERGLLEPGTRQDLLANSLVLIGAPGREWPKNGEDVEALPALLKDGERLVMGDPAHVPAGIYAHGALRSLGLWEELQNRLVFASDVRGALALVERGEAALGIVYATDAAIAPGVVRLGAFPAESHAAIRYPAARVADAQGDGAAAFYDFLFSPEAAEIFRRFGFRVVD